jgi:hypothetical protein
MTQPAENKEPLPFLIGYFSPKQALINASRTHGSRAGASRISPSRSPNETRARRRRRHISPENQFKCPGNLRTRARSRASRHPGTRCQITGVSGTHTSTHHASRKIRIFKVASPLRLGFKRSVEAFDLPHSNLLRRRSSRELGVSWMRSLASFARRSVAEARCVASSRPMQPHSGLRLRLQSQKMHCALFQTNLRISHLSVSSGLINLLFVRYSERLQPDSAASKQGPRGAGTAVRGPNCFLLRPAAFRHALAYGTGGYSSRGLTAESALFFNVLRAEDFLLFFAAIAVHPTFRPTRGIVQFSDRMFHPVEITRTAHLIGLSRPSEI